MWTVGYFMFGIPGESLDDSHQTIEFAKQLDPDWALFSIATPLPGTRLYEMTHDIRTTTDWSRFRFTCNSPVVSYEGMTDKDLKEVLEYAYRSFYVREEWLVNRLRKATSSGQISRIVNSFFFYLGKEAKT